MIINKRPVRLHALLSTYKDVDQIIKHHVFKPKSSLPTQPVILKINITPEFEDISHHLGTLHMIGYKAKANNVN